MPETDILKLTERCMMCTDIKRTVDMKFFQRTGHYVCKPCFDSVTDGLAMAQVQRGYRWTKEASG